MKQHVWWMVLSLGLATGLSAQTEFNPKTGIEAWRFRDEKKMTGTSRHPGQIIGFDMMIRKNRWCFSPGFQYHRISAVHEDKSFRLDFSSSHHMHFFMIPLAFGYTLLDESMLDLSLLGGGEIVFFYNLDQNDVGLDDDMFHGISTALTAALHTEWFDLATFDINYHFGLQPLLKTREQSTVRGLTLALGVQF